MKNTSNIIQFNPNLKGKSRLTEEDIFNACYDKWVYIPRACNSLKTVVHEAIWFIAAIEFLFLKHEKEVVFSWDLLTKKTIAAEKQIKRYLKQIAGIYNIKFHKKYTFKGKIYRAIFSATRTEDSIEILNNPKLFYKQQKKKNTHKKPELKSVKTEQNCPVPQTNLSSLNTQKCPSKRTNLSTNSIYIETRQKEEKTPLTGVSVFSSVHYVDRMDVDSESDFVSQPIHVATTLPTPKPRIRVQADSSKTSTLVTEQTDLLCYPERAASQPCSTENEYGEFVTKKDELVTNCHGLNQSDQPETPETSRYGDSHNEIKTSPTVRENRTIEPLQPAYSSRPCDYAPRKNQNLSSSKGMSSLSELLGEMLNSGELFKESELSTECLQPNPQSLTNQGLPLNEYLNKLNEPMPKTIDEETMKAYDWEDPANKLDLAISRNFDSATAQQLTCDIDYCYLKAESKLRLVFKKKLAISEHNKSRLKQLIRDVYGDNTEIVHTMQNVEKSDVAKITRAQEKFSSQPSKTQKHSSYSGNSYSNNQPKIPSYEERQKALKEFYVKQFAEWDKEIEEKKAKELELEKQKALEITKPKEIFSSLAIEIFAKRRAEREAKNPSKVNVEEEVKRALMLFEEEQKRKNIPQCEFVGLTESAERPLPHIKVPECWNVNKPKSEEV